MKVNSLILVLGLLFPVFVFGQGESNNWYFGENAGITFNADGSVNALTDGQVDTIEGCASISDAEGDLLFYTDGVTVYDRNHNIMPNGTGLFGQVSSSQSAVIAPAPRDPDRYYIFTSNHRAPDFSYPNQGLHYSIVDLTLNGGNGDITTKNSLLHSQTAEKIAVVIKDCTAESFWVVTLGTDDSPLIQPSRRNNLNTYHAYEVTAAGVDPVSVQSPSPNISIDRDGAEGYLKFSPDGTKMASANMDRGLYIYDFDTATGIISNEQQIFLGGTNLHPYGIEFSPNSRYLYTHSSSSRPIFQNSSLFQFDLQAGDNIQISNSRVNLDAVHDNHNITRGALQLGPDGKIYRALQQGFNIAGEPLGIGYLGVINNPDVGGLGANYVHNAVDLNGRESYQGLPPAVISFFNTVDLIPDGIGRVVADYTVCEGQPLMLETQYIPGADYVWRNGNGDIVTDADTDDHIHNIVAATLADAGDYTVTITKPNAPLCPITGTLDVVVSPLPVTNSSTLFVCDEEGDTSDGITTIDLTQLEDTVNFTYVYYQNASDRDAGINPITNPGNYTSTGISQTIYYTAENTTTACSNSAELLLEVGTIAPFSLETSYFICSGNPTVTVNGPTGYDTYSWIRISDATVISTDQNVDISDVGDYRLETTIDYGTNGYCTTNASFNVLQSNLGAADIIPNGNTPIAGSYTICENQTLILQTTNVSGAIYEWRKDNVVFANPGGHIFEINSTDITDGGDYEVTITDPIAASCPVTASLTVVIEASITNAVLEMQVCDTDVDNTEDGVTNMDLTQSADPNFTYTYYETVTDRDSGINPIADPTNFRNRNFAYTPTVYFRTVSATGCGGTGELRITVNTVPSLLVERNHWLCTENPTVSITAPASYDSYQWYRIDGTGRQLHSSNQTAQFNQVGTYVLVANLNFTLNSETISCGTSAEVEILSSNLSVADLEANGNPITDGSFTVCEGQPLELRTDEIVGATYSWTKDGNPITNPNGHILLIDAAEVADAGNYLVTVTGTGALSCPIRGSLDVTVDPLPALTNDSILSCDNDIDDPMDGITTLDLTQIENNTDLTYYYYESEADRAVNSRIPSPENYRNTTAFDQTIYVKTINPQGCENFGEIQIQVQTAPEFVMEESYRICSESSSLVIEGPLGFNSYKWFKLEGASEQLISEDQDFTVDAIGDYMLVATIEYTNSNNQTANCAGSAFFNVQQSEPAVIDDIVIEGNTIVNSIQIIVSGNGDYEYSVDGTSFQDSNFFNDIPSGSTTVYVNDKNGCGTTEQTIEITLDQDLFGFPKFFTPNSDGTNDYWQYVPPPTDQIDLKTIYIYNRYGHLLAQIDPDSNGWDGTRNGLPLPSTDYWFRALTHGSEEIRGHFSLKR